jgi:hypothetical protein
MGDCWGQYLFHSGLHLIKWGPPILYRASVVHSKFTDLNINLIQNFLTKAYRMCDCVSEHYYPAKLTQINHHTQWNCYIKYTHKHDSTLHWTLYFNSSLLQAILLNNVDLNYVSIVPLAQSIRTEFLIMSFKDSLM